MTRAGVHEFEILVLIKSPERSGEEDERNAVAIAKNEHFKFAA